MLTNATARPRSHLDLILGLGLSLSVLGCLAVAACIFTHPQVVELEARNSALRVRQSTLAKNAWFWWCEAHQRVERGDTDEAVYANYMEWGSKGSEITLDDFSKIMKMMQVAKDNKDGKKDEKQWAATDQEFVAATAERDQVRAALNKWWPVMHASRRAGILMLATGMVTVCAMSFVLYLRERSAKLVLRRIGGQVKRLVPNIAIVLFFLFPAAIGVLVLVSWKDWW